MRKLLHITFLLVSLLVIVIILATLIFKDRRPVSDRRLYEALEDGNTNYLEKYLMSGGDVNASIQLYRFERVTGPLLDVAILNGQLGVVDFLINKGADSNRRDSAMHTPLEWAIGGIRNEVNHLVRIAIFKKLLQGGADPNMSVSSSAGYTPLCHAAFLGESDMVSILLAAGVSVNATNHEGLTALNFASNAEVARLLLAAGADRTAHAGGETPVESAIRFGHYSALTVLTNKLNSTGQP